MDKKTARDRHRGRKEELSRCNWQELEREAGTSRNRSPEPMVLVWNLDLDNPQQTLGERGRLKETRSYR